MILVVIAVQAFLIFLVRYAETHTGEYTEYKFVYFCLIVLLGLSVYYTVIWRRSGKDPEKLSIYPVYTPPLDLPAPVLRYILNMGYDNKVFASALIGLVVRGYLEVRKTHDTIVLYATDKLRLLDKADLTEEEDALIRNLMGKTGRIELSFGVGKTTDTLLNAIKEHKRALESAHKAKYFVSNTPHVVIGGIFIFITVFIYCFAKVIVYRQVLWFIVGFYVLMIPFLIFSVITAQKWVMAIQKKQLRRLWEAMTYPLGMYLLLAVFAMDSIPSMIVIQLMVTVTVIFKYLLRAPTEAGRDLRMRIEGFRMFLRATEKDRLNMMHPPEKNSDLVDRYLPYALALDVGHEWGEQFDDEISWAWDIQSCCVDNAPARDTIRDFRGSLL